jgi:hypothetical protein
MTAGMENSRFGIVFVKLREIMDESAEGSNPIAPPLELIGECTREELDAVDELRRITIDVTEQRPQSFTTT